MATTIEIQSLCKDYRLGALTSLRVTAVNQLRKLQGKPPHRRQTFHALQHLNLSVPQGEVLGIIGHNGAGKSTLLKLIAGIVTPTEGSITVHGRIAPLIELGAGLVPDMTGRENIYLNGAILGMSRAEIRNKFDEIVDFSELETFLDTPIKRYSSGMQVKLGFSIATSVDAQVLIVDEVLAVGDLAFQRKCFDRMGRMITDKGVTLLVVSHNLRQIQRLCTRVIQLEHGRLVADDHPSVVCNHFYASTNRKIIEASRKASGDTEHLRTSGDIAVHAVTLMDADGRPTDAIQHQQPLNVSVDFSTSTEIRRPELVIGVHTTDFVYLIAASTQISPNIPDALPLGRHSATCLFPRIPLAPGTYSIWFGIFDEHRQPTFLADNLTSFSIEGDDAHLKLPARRLIDVDYSWNVRETKHESHQPNAVTLAAPE